MFVKFTRYEPRDDKPHAIYLAVALIWSWTEMPEGRTGVTILCGGIAFNVTETMDEVTTAILHEAARFAPGVAPQSAAAKPKPN